MLHVIRSGQDFHSGISDLFFPKVSVEDAKKEAEHIRQEKLEQARQEKDSLLKDKKEEIDNLVDHICNIIINTEYEKDKK